MKVVVIGCTHAGTAAVEQILAEHPGTEVTVYERDDNISFLSCGIALYLGHKVKHTCSTQILKIWKNSGLKFI